MKKMIVALLASVTLTAGAFAQANVAEEAPKMTTYTPVAHMEEEYELADVVGLRLTAWGSCQNVTGLDLTLAGEATNAYGLQLALVRNKVIDTAGAVQLALVSNYAGRLAGVQLSLMNEAVLAKGVQLGLLNQASDVRGLQLGLINTTDIIYGYQIGLINVIKGSAVPCLPIINFMLFDE